MYSGEIQHGKSIQCTRDFDGGIIFHPNIRFIRCIHPGFRFYLLCFIGPIYKKKETHTPMRKRNDRCFMKKLLEAFFLLLFDIQDYVFLVFQWKASYTLPIAQFKMNCVQQESFKRNNAESKSHKETRLGKFAFELKLTQVKQC